ncbi:MAG: MazG nucleotide pyrophosphohydrolase domain-containing protein [Candidatus Woesearchaeota archaeon]
MKEILDFVKEEHKRKTKHYCLEDNSKTKYTILAKLMEEVGELSEAILTIDSLQRTNKLSKKIDLEGELADVILVTFVLAEELKVDISKSLKNKMKKVKSRKN